MKRWSTLMLTGLVALITVLPLALHTPDDSGEAFGGADVKAQEMIGQIQPEYEPWFDSLWAPPGPEVESLLFALQAALGAGLIGYYFGLMRGRVQAYRRDGRYVPD